MSPKHARLLAGIWLALIYSTLGLVRPICAALRQQGLLSITLAVASMGVLLLALLALRRDGRESPLVPWIPLALTAVGLVLLSGHWSLPEERVHLIEYGLFGVLIARALPGRLALALALGLLAGTVDEGIQYLLPSRIFDGWDIVANGLASSVCVLLGAGGRTSWLAPGLLLAAGLMLPQIHSPQAAPVIESPQRTGDAESPQVGAGADSLQPPERVDFPSAEAPIGASVLLITVDALRSDAIPPWGSKEVTLPAFDRLAHESVVVEQGFSNSIWTTPGIQSLLTGLLPQVHGVQARGEELPEAPVFPVEQLGDAGYHRIGYAGDATETYRNLGFEREFDKEEDGVDQAIEALAADQPTFVWLHLRDIHAPYDAPPDRLAELGLPSDLPASPILDRARSSALVPRRDFPGRHDWLRPAIRSLYLSEVVDADRRLGELLAKMEAGGLLERTLVVLTADHGEELLEHHGIGHASTTLNSAPQPELVRIPFFFRLPDAARGGARIAGRFEQVDLMPTLFGLLGLPLRQVKAGVDFDGADRSGWVLGRASVAEGRPRPTIVSSTPCGWQCPPERRGERVHARIDGAVWDWCRPPQVPCTGSLAASLAEQAQRAKLLRAE